MQTMTLERFRKNKGLVEWLEKITGSSEWKLLMEAMENAHTRHTHPHPAFFSEPSAALILGRILGYDECLNNLKAC